MVSVSSTETAADSAITFGIQKLDVPFTSLDSLLIILTLSIKEVSKFYKQTIFNDID